MTHPKLPTRTLYIPHVDGTLAGDLHQAEGGQPTGRDLPALTEAGRARAWLGAYFEANPADALAGHPARPMAMYRIDAQVSDAGRVTVAAGGALTDPTRQIVTVGTMQRPHPRALTVAYHIASSSADAALHDKRVTDPVGRAANAVRIAWRHGHDLAYTNSWPTVTASAATMGYRLGPANPVPRTPPPPEHLLVAAARLATSDQIAQVVEQAWRSALAHGSRHGTTDAARRVAAEHRTLRHSPAALGSVAAAVAAEWANPQLAQLTSELGRINRARHPERIATIARLDAYLVGAQLTPTVEGQPVRRSPAGAPRPGSGRLPPPPRPTIRFGRTR